MFVDFKEDHRNLYVQLIIKFRILVLKLITSKSWNSTENFGFFADNFSTVSLEYILIYCYFY